MYNKDLTKTITIRVNDTQYKTIEDISKQLGVSKTKYVRMLVDSSCASYMKLLTAINDIALKQGGNNG